MSRVGELMALFLQETEETDSTTTTIMDLLRDRAMNGDDRLRRRKTLHEWLGLKSMVCCGSIWAMNTRSEVEENDVVVVDDSIRQQIEVNLTPPPDSNSDHVGVPPTNLAAALAAERQFRSTVENVQAVSPMDPLRKSLMRLLEETDGQDDEIEGLGRDQVCCVCMGRKKGAAIVPCGHTFCRVCSRELWLTRGSCPLCNRPILDILHIY